MNEDLFLEPQKSYKQLSEINEKEICDFFDDLVEKSGINVEENRATVKKIDETQQEIDDQSKILNQKRGSISLVTTLCVIGIIGSIIAILVGIYQEGNFLFYLIPGLIIAACIFFMIFIRKKLNPIINAAEESLSKLQKQKQELIKEAYAQTKPLCDLFDWNMSNKLFTKTIPIINLDDYFNMGQYQFLHDRYGFDEDRSTDTSTLFVQSGTILGNPFVIKRDLNQSWVEQKYTGSLTIYWTTTSFDSEGHVHTHHHSETLYASVYKPMPNYYTNTTLIYGNEAAPDLSFSRHPTRLSFSSEKEEDKYMRKLDKKLDEMTAEATKTGRKFTRMSNTDFEGYFNALDRDNPVQFRLLFTPLAQLNFLKLLKAKDTPFGDDFTFIKVKKLNAISSGHSQTFDYSGDPSHYNSYNFDEIENQFKEYNKTYFKYLYYDFVPLMSIPLYQQTKTREYIYGQDYDTNITSYETEVLANSYDPAIFKHPKTATQVILKREFVEKEDGTDYDRIHAYSYRVERRVEYVSTLGGDGEFHMVPVPWDEYLPVEKTTDFSVQSCNTSRQRFDNCYRNGALDSFLSLCKNGNGIMYQRGILSLLNKQKFDGKALNNLLDKEKED